MIFFLILLNNVVTYWALNITINAVIGRTIILKCNVKPNSITAWTGPAHTNFQNVRIYADGQKINPSIEKKKKFSIVGSKTKGHYNLKIKNVTFSEEGKYRCLQSGYMNVQPKETVYFLKVKAELIDGYNSKHETTIQEKLVFDASTVTIKLTTRRDDKMNMEESSSHWLLSGNIIGGLVILLIISYIIFINQRQRDSNAHVQTQADDQSQTQPYYEEIEDINIISINTRPVMENELSVNIDDQSNNDNEGFDTESNHSSSSGGSGFTGETNGYLNPYEHLQHLQVDTNVYKTLSIQPNNRCQGIEMIEETV